MGQKIRLQGINEICDFTELQADTLLKWRARYGFPMTRNTAGIWEADPVEIVSWFKVRGVNPQTATKRKLDNYLIQQKRENGTAKVFKKELVGMNDICDFLKLSAVGVLGLLRFSNCPIQRKDAIYRADADTLDAWYEDIRQKGYGL
jgi:hypothetical protein